MIKEAVILAGGLGTRLKGVITDIPKPMAPIAGKPFLEYILSFLLQQNFSRVVLSVGYKNETIKNYFGDNFKGLEIDYAVENEPLGTGGAIKLALERVKAGEVFILNGDTFLNANLENFSRFCREEKYDVGIVVKKMHNFDRYGTVSLDSGRVVQFNEKKPVEQGYINCGLYFLNKKIIEQFQFPDKFSFETEFLEKYTSQLKFGAYISNRYFIDIGIPEDYQKAQADLPTQLNI